MNKQRKTSHILNVFQYDETTGAVTLPSSLSLATPDSTDNSTKVATTAWIRAYVGSLSYATASSVTTAIANLVASAPTTLDTLNELATALGNDPNFATTITTSIGTKVPQSRTITINGTAYDLSADRAWTIASGVTSFNTRTGAITLTSGDVTGALGYTPYNATNPSGYITGITSGMVSTALGYTPYNSTNPSGYITSSGSISGSSGSVIGLTLTSSANGINPDNVTQNQIGYNTSVSLFGQTDGGLYSSAYSSSWIHQIYGDFRTGQIAIRGKNSGTWQAWRTVLDSSNHTSYSPSLTGGGASGTWAISISGNAATATSATTAGSTGSLDGYTWGSAGKMVRGSDFYTDGWFRNYNNNQGLYSQANGTHFYSNSGEGFVVTGSGGIVQLQFKSNHETTLRGYVYGDTSSNFGLLNNQGGWSVRCNPGTGYGGTLSGEWVMTGPFTANGAIRVNANDNLYLDYNYGCSIVGVYTSTRYQGIFAMGNAYKLPIDGSSTGSLYGLAWSHPNAGGVASNLNTHGLLVMENGTFLAAISGSIKARDDMRAPIFYDSNDTTYYCDPTGNSRLVSLNIGYTSGTTYNTGASGKIYFNNHGESDINGYSIGTTVVSMNGYNYTKLDLSWHTGIRIGAYSLYGGTRFYNNSPAYYDGGEVMSIASGDNHIRINYDLYVGYGRGSSNIFMYDSDETSRRIHCNSNRIGFLNSSDGWGAWCNNDGSFQSARKVQGEYLYSDGWIYSSGGNTGWLQDNQNQGIRAAGYNSYFGTIATYGTNSNGYGGYTIMNNYRVILMQNSSGDFGFYNNDDWAWQLFYSRSNNCWGIGTDNTYSGDGFRCVKYGSSQYGWTTWSDRRAKENISSITGALDKVLNMRGVYFNYISDEAKTQRVGFIAQELEQVLPEAVRYAEEIDEYNVEYAQIVSVLTEAIKEQNAKITRLEALVEQLTNN